MDSGRRYPHQPTSVDLVQVKQFEGRLPIARVGGGGFRKPWLWKLWCDDDLNYSAAGGSE